MVQQVKSPVVVSRRGNRCLGKVGSVGEEGGDRLVEKVRESGWAVKSMCSLGSI